MEQIVLFDYMGLDAETRIIVQQEDKEFDQNMESAGRSFVFACRNLQRIHKTLLYTRPGFVEYIAAKPGMSKSTAYKMLNVAEMFPHYGNISAAPSALYLLASPSTPEPARLEAIERAEAGEVITHKTAKEIVTEYQRKEFQDAQDERRFAKELFGPEPVLVHGPIGNYTQEGSLKRCEKCHQLWAADLNYCPYCNISPDARALHLQNERLPLTASNHAVSETPGYDGDEWYTPVEYIDAARLVMGSIDLDPASCVAAQNVINATTFYTKEDDGLSRTWSGNVFLNPPYSVPLIQDFTGKVLQEFDEGNISQAIVLTNNSSDTRWFHSLLSRFPACFTRGRVQFWRPNLENFGTRQGQVFFYLGPNVELFRKLFSEFGIVVSI